MPFMLSYGITVHFDLPLFRKGHFSADLHWDSSSLSKAYTAQVVDIHSKGASMTVM